MIAKIDSSFVITFTSSKDGEMVAVYLMKKFVTSVEVFIHAKRYL